MCCQPTELIWALFYFIHFPFLLPPPPGCHFQLFRQPCISGRPRPPYSPCHSPQSGECKTRTYILYQLDQREGVLSTRYDHIFTTLIYANYVLWTFQFLYIFVSYYFTEVFNMGYTVEFQSLFFPCKLVLTDRKSAPLSQPQFPPLFVQQHGVSMSGAAAGGILLLVFRCS